MTFILVLWIDLFTANIGYTLKVQKIHLKIIEKSIFANYTYLLNYKDLLLIRKRKYSVH